MSRKIVIGFTLVGLGLLALGQLASPPAAAAPPGQLTPFPTPTPGPDGRIIYIVQPGDTLWRVAAVSGLGVDELIGLNDLDAENPVILEGQELLLGLGGPSQVNPTAGPPPSPTPLLLTPEDRPGNGFLCVLLFDDQDGDGFRQEEEPPISGGAISISNRAGTVSRTGTTSAVFDEDGEVVRDCFEDLPEGAYNVSVAVPDSYNPTTELNYLLRLQGGDEAMLDFGAQLSSEALSESPSPEEGGRSPMLGLIGGMVLILGIGLGLFAGLLRRRNLF
jgi:hypothetical protein